MRAKTNLKRHIEIFAGVFLGLILLSSQAVYALNPIATPTPESNSYGLEATKPQPPPTQGATIAIPSSGASYSTSPITVSGICPNGLLIEVYDNNVMVGAVNCTSGSFSLQVSLFTGSNVLTVNDYDDLGQPGPASNSVTVNYNNAQFQAFGQLITLTSTYGRQAVATGADLTWPLLLSGGTGPYAFSINWGDSPKNELKSQATAGNVSIDHVYTSSGIYHVTIQVTDVNGASAFLQVVAVVNGSSKTAILTASGGSKSNKTTQGKTTVLWTPAIIALVLMAPVYFLGRKSELVAIRKRLDKERTAYESKKEE